MGVFDLEGYRWILLGARLTLGAGQGATERRKSGRSPQFDPVYGWIATEVEFLRALTRGTGSLSGLTYSSRASSSGRRLVSRATRAISVSIACCASVQPERMPERLMCPSTSRSPSGVSAGSVQPLPP